MPNWWLDSDSAEYLLLLYNRIMDAAKEREAPKDRVLTH